MVLKSIRKYLYKLFYCALIYSLHKIRSDAQRQQYSVFEIQGFRAECCMTIDVKLGKLFIFSVRLFISKMKTIVTRDRVSIAGAITSKGIRKVSQCYISYYFKKSSAGYREIECDDKLKEDPLTHLISTNIFLVKK